MTGWLKTLDGADVYTEDGEWYWSHEQQGWFYAPDLLTAVPAPPLETRVRDEVQRLKTGWPPILLIFSWRFARQHRMLTGTLLGHAGLLWMWVYKIGIDYGVHNVARAWQKEVYAAFFVTSVNSQRGAWYYEGTDTDQHARYLVFSAIFFVITLAILYSLYVGVATAYDVHKGALMLGAVVATTAWHQHRRNQRQHDQQVARDIADEIHHRHYGGFGDGYR